MTNLQPLAATEFMDGDQVVLVEGLHPGTPGVFLHFQPDRSWAEIRERNGEVRAHPVVWLRHARRNSDAAA